MPRESRQDSRDWSLFVDWCRSHDLEPLPTTAEIVADFLEAFPAPLRSQGRRVRAIRQRHELAGTPLDLPAAAAPTVWRSGDDWGTLSDALSQLPAYQHPKGLATALRARRDGWLLILVGLLGMTRNAARRLAQDAVDVFPSLSIAGRVIPSSSAPGECPACAVTRWLRVVGPASFGWRQDIVDAVRPSGLESTSHDCRDGLDGTWRRAPTLLPGIDRHGWLSADPITSRAVSALVADRQSIHAPTEQRLQTQSTGRFAQATMDELAAAYDDVDERAAAMLLRLKAIVGDGDSMLDRLKSFDL